MSHPRGDGDAEPSGRPDRGADDATHRREPLYGGVDLRELVERYLYGVILIVDGRVRYANRILLEMTGYSTEEALDRPVEDFLAPDQHGKARRRISALESGGSESPSEYELIRRDGTLQSVEVLSRRIEYHGRPALMSVIRDISDRKRAEQRLRESEERYRVLYEDNPSMYFTVDRSGVVLSVNKFGAEQLGYRPDELVGQPVLGVFHEEDTNAVLEQLDDCLAHRGTVRRWEFRKVRKDGTVLWVRERARTVQDADGNDMVLIVCEDITDQIDAERERRHLEAQIQHAQKLESLGIMAGGIAHDFNNLLVGILGNAGLALTKLPPGSSVREDIASVQKAADRAAELCKQLLAYSGRGRFDVRLLDLSDIVGDLRDLLAVAVSKRAALVYELADDLPPIRADAAQIRQVIMNLVTNASEALETSDGSITVATRAVEIEEGFECPVGGPVSRGRYVSLEVSDTGRGMDEATLGKIFDPFFTTKFTGRGLGLAAVLGIVHGHDGAIRVESRPGRGTAFRALFPCSDEAPEEVVPPPEPDTASEPATGTVLVVDDESVVREVARQTLEGAGYEVVVAADGAEGIRRFSERTDEISLVLLDMTMPGLSGEESFRILRTIRHDVKVLLSSGYDEQEATSRFEGELDGFIQKPYRPEQLVTQVRRILER